jgi:2-dehydropantoate 2-reductase
VICSDPATRALSKAIMLESQAIAEKFGVKFRVDVEQRIEGRARSARTKPRCARISNAGARWRSTRWSQEMRRLTQTPTPALDALLALVAQRAGVAGLFSLDRPVEVKTPAYA